MSCLHSQLPWWLIRSSFLTGSHTHTRAHTHTHTASAENGADSLSNMMTNSLTLQTWQMCLCNVFVFSMKMKMKAAQRRWQEVRKAEWKANSFTGAHSAGVFRAPGVIVRGQSEFTTQQWFFHVLMSTELVQENDFFSPYHTIKPNPNLICIIKNHF